MTNESNKPEVKEIDCLEAFDHIYAYLNNEISNPLEIAQVEHHISHCKSCFSRTQMERELNQRIKETGKSEVPGTLKERMGKLLDEL